MKKSPYAKFWKKRKTVQHCIFTVPTMPDHLVLVAIACVASVSKLARKRLLGRLLVDIEFTNDRKRIDT